jgi:hypothetical protein
MKASILKFLIHRGVSFEHVRCGSVNTYNIENTTKKKFYSRFDREIMNACKSVRREMLKYKSSNELPHIISNATTYYRNNRLFPLYMNKEVLAIDINACYWNILHNNKMISDVIYYRYLDNKKARLISVGNLFKKTFVSYYHEGELVSKNPPIENECAFGWLFVVSESYRLLLEAIKRTDDNILKFKTDCFFVLDEHAQTIFDILTENGLTYKTERKILKVN